MSANSLKMSRKIIWVCPPPPQTSTRSGFTMKYLVIFKLLLWSSNFGKFYFICKFYYDTRHLHQKKGVKKFNEILLKISLTFASNFPQI